MNLENGEANLSYTGELCVEDPSSYYSNYAAAEENEIGIGYLEENNINVVNYDLEDEMRRMQQHLELEKESSCNLNLVNLLSMSSSSSTTCSAGWGWGLGSASGSGVVYEPVQQLHLNLTPQQTQGYCGGREPVRQPKNFVTERQRRQTFNDKFVHLRSLLPNPNKNDRASIVGDAIEYIKELTRTVKELSILVDKKKRDHAWSTNRINKPHKASTTATDQDGDTDKNEQEESLRSSWLQRRCKDTDIDVRIVHDDLTVKLVQRKTVFNLLLYVSRTFDDLKLDLHHVTGGNVGDYCTFLFNTKISQGSSLYASAIADRLIQLLQRQYAAFH